MTFGKMKTIAATLIAGALVLGLSPANAAEGGTKIKAGIRGSYINSSVLSSTSFYESTLRVNGSVSPTLRFDIPLTSDWSMELGGRFDYYFADLDNSTAEKSSFLSGFTFDAGPVYHFGTVGDGTLTPFAKAAVGTRILNIRLKAPVEKYEYGLYYEVCAGLEAKKWDVRAGYAWSSHQAGHHALDAIKQYSLDVPEIFVELTYKLDFSFLK